MSKMSFAEWTLTQVKEWVGIIAVVVWSARVLLKEYQLYGAPVFSYKGSIDPARYICTLFVL